MTILKFLTASALAAVIAIASDASKAAEKPEPQISGEVVKSLRNLGEDFHVKVVLNKTDPLALQGNIGKSEPIMLSEIKRIRENGIPFENGVVPHGILLESGSHIEFQIEVNKPGPCGFGFDIRTGKEEIAKGLYRVDTEGKNEALATAVRRYQNAEKTIQVDDLKTMGLENITAKEKIEYITCQINGWRVDGFKQNGITYPRPYRECAPRRESAMVSAKVKGAVFHEGVKSDSKFGSISEVTRGDQIGHLTFRLFVFANLEEKERFYNTYQDFDLGDF